LSFVSSFITTPWWILKRIATPRNGHSPLFHKLKRQICSHFLISLTVPCVSRNEIISHFFFSNQLKKRTALFFSSQSIKPCILMVTNWKPFCTINEFKYNLFGHLISTVCIRMNDYLNNKWEYNHIRLSISRCAFQQQQQKPTWPVLQAWVTMFTNNLDHCRKMFTECHKLLSYFLS
jgi:hypothetical protein